MDTKTFFSFLTLTLNLYSLLSHAKTHEPKRHLKVFCFLVRDLQTMCQCCRGWQGQGSANYGLWANPACSLFFFMGYKEWFLHF